LIPSPVSDTVHPHVRGDGHQHPVTHEHRLGSPPRAWGRRRESQCDGSVSRFTPTCVGTAITRWLATAPLAVHPHVRGDGLTSNRVPESSCGSPPRAWGRQTAASARSVPIRFTPTCVGTARGSRCGPAPSPVHPHVRGDGKSPRPPNLRPTGSPPRAWGRPVELPNRAARRRFTPTCVGTASRRCGTTFAATVHPHVRGDGAANEAADRGELGSPPRAWGRPVAFASRVVRSSFTPTCVGTARFAARECRSIAVHPHVRGDGANACRKPGR